METVPTEWVQLGRNLLEQVRTDRITMEEFEKEMAYLAINCGFEEVRFRDYPTRITQLREYDALRNKNSVSPEFWKQPPVARYLELCKKCKGHNYSTFKWLNTLLERFERYGDTVRVAMVKERMR